MISYLNGLLLSSLLVIANATTQPLAQIFSTDFFAHNHRNAVDSARTLDFHPTDDYPAGYDDAYPADYPRGYDNEPVENRNECGDGQVNGNEECDDGNDDNTDMCTNRCRYAVCGDGHTQEIMGEECDDKNQNDGDECTNFCTLPRCGDGIVSDEEDCDDGAMNGSPDYCSYDCDGMTEMPEYDDFDDGYDDENDEEEQNRPPEPECGNGIMEDYEECDDGNDNNRDECGNDCRVGYCGDGIWQPAMGEECDEGDRNGERCNYSCQRMRPAAASEASQYTEEELEAIKEHEEPKDAYSESSFSSEYSQNTEYDAASSNGPTVIDLPFEPADEDDAFIDDASNNDEYDNTNYFDNEPIDDFNYSASSSNDIDYSDDTTSVDDTYPEAIEHDSIGQPIDLPTDDEEASDETEEESEDSDLGCFDADGNWSADRDDCDKDQVQHMQGQAIIVEEEVIEVAPPPVVEFQFVPEEEVRQRIEQKILGDRMAEQKRQRLLNAMDQARLRLETLHGIGAHDEESELYITDSLKWLDQGIHYFSQPRKLDEVEQMIGPVREVIEQVKEMVIQKQYPQANLPEIAPILDKTERLLSKFRESFVALVQGGVQLDQGALQAYVDAANMFEDAKTACLTNNTECYRIGDVLEILKQAKEPVQVQLEANPEIYDSLKSRFE